jgi:ectoine hydroxylase-related dioxygenase (phytanoyl-CoA dioxygenase family)
MGMHADQNHQGTPAPFPAMAQTANVTWALTDYDEANGATCFVAGSHKLCRPPSPYEARDLSLFRPVTAPAGSVLIWHGNTWHGSVPRRTPGFRVNMIYDFVRWYNRVGAPIAPTLPPEAFARNPARFGVLTGATPIRTVAGQGRAAILGHYA